jgi:hypothetical protein
MSQGKTVAKIFFLGSLIPYAVISVLAISAAINGFTVLFDTVYGIEAAKRAVLVMAWLMCIYPILPICAGYQIIYFICALRRKNWQRHRVRILKKTEENTPP